MCSPLGEAFARCTAKLDLRFPCSQAEAAFKANYERQLVRTSIIVGCVYICVIAFTIIPPILATASFCSVWACFIVLVAVYVALGTAFVFWQWFLCLNWELFSVMVVVVSLVMLPFVSCWYMPKVFGYGHHTVLGDPEMSMVLTMVTILSVNFNLSPIRSCVLWMPVVCANMTFVLAVLIAGSQVPEQVPKNFAILLILSVLGWWSAWRYEVHIREKWITRQELRKSQVVVDEQRLDIHELEAEIEELQNSLRDQQLKVRERDEQLQTLRNNSDVQQADIREREAQIDDLKLELLEQQLETGGREARIRELQDSVDERQVMVQELRSHIQELQDSVFEQRAKNHELEARIKDMEDYLQDQQHEIEDQMGPLPGLGFLGRPSEIELRIVHDSFHGHWRLIEGKAALWLQSIHIHGDRVTLGDGSVTWLKVGPGSQTQLEGGAIYFENGLLCRLGKSRTILKFKRVTPEPRTTMPAYDDRDTCVSFDDASSVGFDCHIADLRDFGLSENTSEQQDELMLPSFVETLYAMVTDDRTDGFAEGIHVIPPTSSMAPAAKNDETFPSGSVLETLPPC